MKRVWGIERCEWWRPRMDELLADGWEPFAVDHGFIFLKKVVG